MGYFIGVDIGTQGTKGVIVDLNGKVLASSYRPHNLITPKPGWAEEEAKEWERSSYEVIKELMDSVNDQIRKKIVSITFSGLYGGSGVPVDEKMEPIRPALIWMDRRATKETEWVKKNIPKEILVETTGNYVDSYFGFTKILWIKNHEPEVWKKTYKFITPKDYIIYKLTSKLIIDHTSAGNLGGVYDLKKLKWSEEMADMLGIDLKKLPEDIVPSYHIVGEVKKDMAKALNLPEGIKVVAGGIDAAVAQLSAGVVEKKEQVIMLGTSMCWGTLHSGENITPNLVNFPYVINEKELVYTFGGGATSGAVISWFVNNLTESKGNIFEELEKEAIKIPAGSEGLIVLPYFMGERSPIWDPQAKGVIFGLSLKHSRAHLYRAFLEGVAYSLLHNIESAHSAGLKLPKKSYIVGGGAKSDLWIQILSDVTGYEITRLQGNIEAPLGDAFLGCYGTKFCKDYREIKSWINEEKRFFPRKIPEYEKMYEIYKEIYINTKKFMHLL